jgi:hypothetical protein
MTKPIARDPIYRRRQFNKNIIQLCVRWYVTYRLSYRDLVEMMAERGIFMSRGPLHRFVRRWAQHLNCASWKLVLTLNGGAFPARSLPLRAVSRLATASRSTAALAPARV